MKQLLIILHILSLNPVYIQRYIKPEEAATVAEYHESDWLVSDTLGTTIYRNDTGKRDTIYIYKIETQTK